MIVVPCRINLSPSCWTSALTRFSFHKGTITVEKSLEVTESDVYSQPLEDFKLAGAEVILRPQSQSTKPQTLEQSPLDFDNSRTFPSDGKCSCAQIYKSKFKKPLSLVVHRVNRSFHAVGSRQTQVARLLQWPRPMVSPSDSSYENKRQLALLFAAEEWVAPSGRIPSHGFGDIQWHLLLVGQLLRTAQVLSPQSNALVNWHACCVSIARGIYPHVRYQKSLLYKGLTSALPSYW